MANELKWSAAGAAVSVLTTEMNSLATNTLSAQGGALDNSASGSTTRKRLWTFELVLGSLTPAAGGYINLYCAAALDGTNYPDTKRESIEQLVGTFALDVATAAKRTTIGVAIGGVILPPYPLKFYVDNQAGVTLAASGNTVKAFPHSEELQ